MGFGEDFEDVEFAEIEDVATGTDDPPFLLIQEGGVEVGRVVVTNGVVEFIGDVEPSARIFFEANVAYFQKYLDDFKESL